MGKRVVLTVSFILIALGGSYADAVGCASGEACSTEGDFVKRSDFPWDQSLEEIKDLAEVIYDSGKVLPKRAYIDGSKVNLPLEEDKVESWGFNFDTIQVETDFVENLKTHIKKMKIKKFGTELIYSDVGHVHIFASHEDSQTLDEANVSSDDAEYYETLFKSKNTKFLYHTAEQLRTPQNEAEERREQNRNIVGDASGNIKVTPFSKQIEGHSQTFSIYFNASHRGRFSVNEKKFDISFSSPE